MISPDESADNGVKSVVETDSTFDRYISWIYKLRSLQYTLILVGGLFGFFYYSVLSGPYILTYPMWSVDFFMGFEFNLTLVYLIHRSLPFLIAFFAIRLVKKCNHLINTEEHSFSKLKTLLVVEIITTLFLGTWWSVILAIILIAMFITIKYLYKLS